MAKKPIYGCTIKFPEEFEIFYQAAGATLPPGMLTALVDKRWPGGKVDLSVSFLDNPAPGLRTKILAHMNAWGEFSAVRFRETGGVGQVRISRDQAGYWSYLGTDILRIPQNRPTLNLGGFTLSTPDSEFRRVVAHEAGHTLGFAHEHLRRETIVRLDERKTIAYFARTQGWSEQVTRQQVLTPLAEGAIIGTATSDETSIMCYPLPASITRDGKPVVGGADFSTADREFAARVYPKGDQGEPPTRPVFMVLLDAVGRELERFALQGVD